MCYKTKGQEGLRIQLLEEKLQDINEELNIDELLTDWGLRKLIRAIQFKYREKKIFKEKIKIKKN